MLRLVSGGYIEMKIHILECVCIHEGGWYRKLAFCAYILNFFHI